MVLGPLAAGLALCALALWSALANLHNQAAFRAHAVPAKAVIDQIYAGPVQYGNGGGSYFDQYALVRFAARGATAHARVLLVPGCSGTCFPGYHVGQLLTVYYNPQNLNYAQLSSQDKSSWFGDWILFGFLGLIFIAAAVINVVTAGRL